ncbi:hypothetical protein D3C72_1998580 [compost metagenome]
MYDSEMWPPCVLTGNFPPTPMPFSEMNLAASPGLQKPNPSSAKKMCGLKLSYTSRASISLGPMPAAA